MLRVMLALAFGLVACGGGTEDTSSTPTPATVTVRFTNPTGSDVFIDATYRAHQFSQGGKLLPGTHDCTQSCSSSCQCYYCGAPQNVVRRIPSDGAWEVGWNGTWYELSKECGGGQCSCESARIAPFGSTKVEILGARGRNPADEDPIASDPNLFVGTVDTSGGTCAGTATFELDAHEKIVDVPFTCTP
jgi:hypothetical protein